MSELTKGDRISQIRDAVTLRPAADADYDFLRRLYHSTRAEEMKQFPFTDEQKAAFLDQQFAAQHQYYTQHYPTCERNLIVVRDEPVGRLWTDEWGDQIRIVDIALMPEWRGRGLGESLVRDVLTRGERVGKPVTIHVEGFNPALRMYERLGFQNVHTNGVYYLMKWTPSQANAAS